MRVKALVSFAGIVSMGVGEVRDISDKAIVDDLLRAGYVKEDKDTPDEASTASLKKRKGSVK